MANIIPIGIALLVGIAAFWIYRQGKKNLENKMLRKAMKQHMAYESVLNTLTDDQRKLHEEARALFHSNSINAGVFVRLIDKSFNSKTAPAGGT